MKRRKREIMTIQKVSSCQLVSNLPKRQKYEDVYFEALKDDSVIIKEQTGDKLVLNRGDVESFYQFDHNGNEIFHSSFNSKTKEGRKFLYHNPSSTSPTMKVVQYGKDVQAVKVKTQINQYSSSDLAKDVYTREGDTTQRVWYDAFNNKAISTGRKTPDGQWEDTYPENVDASKKIDFWV